MKALDGIKVLDFTHAHGGPLATMYLADYGAEVVKVEPPGGEDGRSLPPMKNGGSGYFAYLNRGKKSVCADLDSEADRAFILELVKEADVVCENFSYAVMERHGLGYDDLKKISPGIIYASLSGPGRSGSKKEMKHMDEQISALSGMLERTGYPDSPPVELGIQLSCQTGAVYLVMAIMLALIHRKDTGEGQMIDISMVDSMVSIIEGTCVTYALTGEIYPRSGNSQFSISPYDTFNMKNGDAAVAVCTDAQWQKFLGGLKMDDIAANEKYASNEQRGLEYDNGLRSELADRIKDFDLDSFMTSMHDNGIASSQVCSVYDTMESDQIKERRMLTEVDDKNVGKVVMPSRAVKFGSDLGDGLSGSGQGTGLSGSCQSTGLSGLGQALGISSSPSLGQDTEYFRNMMHTPEHMEIAARMESDAANKNAQASDDPACTGSGSLAGADSGASPCTGGGDPGTSSNKKILDGMTVIDFTQAYSGPFSTMQLADFGAKVIKLERCGSGDQSREWSPFRNGHSGYYAAINRNKLGMTLDLKSEEGLAIAKKLIAKADVVTENFKVGTMEKLGLGYDEVKKINPSIIYASISGFGQSGPLKDRPAYDNVIQAMSGIQDMTGFPDEQAVRCGSSTGDNYTGLVSSMAILMAYWKKLNTGEGERVDVAMLDALFAMMEYHIICKTLLGEEHVRSGNSEKDFLVPYDLYECADGYFSVGVRGDEQWKAFCDCVGLDSLRDPRFSSNDSRRENFDDLTSIISGWMKSRKKAELTSLFVDAGIPSSPLYDVMDIMDDEHTRERGMVVTVDDPGLGPYEAIANPMKLEKAGASYSKGAPLLGEDNEQILKELGYTADEIADFARRGVI